MVTDNNFVRSGRERIADDNYQTVDHRCVQALVETVNMSGGTKVVDVCSPQGSGIIDYFEDTNVEALPCSDAFIDYVDADWIIFNPPYKRDIVDKIIYRQIQRIVDNQVSCVAALLRTGFDHAKTRKPMFQTSPYYDGQIKMLFRPLWFIDTDITPIHNYVWHIWSRGIKSCQKVWYW